MSKLAPFVPCAVFASGVLSAGLLDQTFPMVVLTVLSLASFGWAVSR